ncbi:hypothetical protein [Streptomyces sp. NPDC055134]
MPPAAHQGDDGFDTFDSVLDLLVDADLEPWSFMDRNEYAHARRLGAITDAEHQAVGTPAPRYWR